MKYTSLIRSLASALVLGWIAAGCATTDKPPVSSQPSTAEPVKTGLACTQCTCRKFEPRVEDANICRMCWHPLANHTR